MGHSGLRNHGGLQKCPLFSHRKHACARAIVARVVMAVPGREYQAFAKLPDARAPHRVLVQVPDNFDARARCVIVCASSGSRGIYGSISVTGAWGLPRGCAVAYTDKGAGQGYFDCAEQSGVALDGTRVRAGESELDFAPAEFASDAGIA